MEEALGFIEGSMSTTDSSLSLFTKDELDDFCSDMLYGDCLPYVCEGCQCIAGYYAASFGDIACPHCGDTAMPISLMAAGRERPLLG